MKKVGYLSIIIFFNLLMLLGGAINWPFQFGANLILAYILSYLLRDTKWLKYIAALPMLVAFLYVLWGGDRFYYYQISMIVFSPLLLSLVLSFKKKWTLPRFVIFACMVSLFSFSVMRNICDAATNKNDINHEYLKTLAFTSETAKTFDTKQPFGAFSNDTTYIIKYWTQYCGFCIEGFPKLNDITKYHSKEKIVVANIMLIKEDHFKEDSLVAAEYALNKYLFRNFFLELEEIKTPVPVTVIIKNNRTVFTGVISNSKWDIFNLYNYEIYF